MEGNKAYWSPILLRQLLPDDELLIQPARREKFPESGMRPRHPEHRRVVPETGAKWSPSAIGEVCDESYKHLTCNMLSSSPAQLAERTL